MSQPLVHNLEMEDVKPRESPRSGRAGRPMSPTKRVQVGGEDPLASMVGNSPHETYGWWHWAFYTWVGQLLTHGWDRDAAKEPMGMSDLLRMPAFEDPRENQRRLQEEWKRELQACAEARAANPVPAGATEEEARDWHAPSLGRVLWRTFRVRVIIGGLFRLISDGCTVGSAFILREFVKWMGTPDFMTTEGEGWKWLGVLVGIQLVMSLTLNASMHHTFIGFEQMRSACVLEVFDSALRFSADHTETGKILSAHASDTQNFVEIAQFVHGVWVSPLLVIAAVISLVVFIGWAGLVCFGVMLITMPAQGFVMRFVFNARSDMLTEGDVRVGKINECLQGIRICKFMGWEENFAQRIAAARSTEVACFARMQRWRVMLNVIMQAIPMLLNFLMFVLVYAMDEANLTPQNIFPAYTMLNTLRMPLTLVPLAVAKLFDVQLACQRIQRIMMDNGRIDYVKQHTDSEATGSAMTMDNVTVVGRGGQIVAANLTLAIPKNALTVVVGATASGKSTLIKALIGEAEIDRTHGSVHHYGTAALVPQEAWIMNATVRKNITMDLPFEQMKYDATVLACQLTSDFEQLTAGDATEIGERGINVSGGQKQRIAFARAVYSGRDTVLMDDPLSAVDSHVSAALFDGCICGALKGRTRVLVTHQVQLLPHADYAVLMEDCKIKFAGTVEELRATGYELPSIEDAHKAETHTESHGDTKKPAAVPGPAAVVKKEEGKLMSDEGTAVGGIAWATYGWYVNLGSVATFLGVLCMGLFAQTGFTISNIVMARWSARQPVLASLGEWSQLQYIEWMGIFTAIGIVFLVARVLLFAQFSINCAEKSHDALARNVLRAPTSFFDTTPMGRIINRFTKDMASIDTLVSNHMELGINLMFTICGTIFLVCYSSVWLILIFPPVILLFCVVFMYYSKTVRGLKRLENTNRSPMLAIMNEVVGGLASIRVYRIQHMLMETHASRTVTALLPSYNLRAAQRWLSSRTELLAAVIVFFCCLFGVLSKTKLKDSLNVNPAIMSLAVSNAIAVTNVVTYLVRSLADLETEMSSTERVKQYSEDIPQEAALAYAGEDGALAGAPAAPPKSWPATARVELDDYSLRYRDGLPLVLRDLTFAIENKQKIGVVGRTGSGKSTLLLAIFRIVEAAGGRISIDGRDIATLKLADLRKAITIIPQDPMLFSGTVRSNLDPFSEHSDDVVWAVLDRLHLRPRLTTFITEGPSGLEAPVAEKGGNFSVGQRQLLCMARALLKRAPILMLDEATASVDFETDAMIQRLIREEFKDCTVITIAHRLATIIDSDKVLVLSHGDFLEMDHPSVLLRKQDGALRGMVERLGPDQFNMLMAIADGKAEVGGDVLQVHTAVDD